MPPSLYIHIPFCLKKCIYCDFVSGIFDPVKADTYIDALINELSMIPSDIPLSTLYIGGGTPTSLHHETLSNLLAFIDNTFIFNDNELTIEANPGTLDKDKLCMIRASGINRISIGVQSFNNDELSFLGRIHSSQEAEEAVLMARSAGLDNIGIDLIYGIPGQDTASWKRSLEKAVSLMPKHISTYELTVEEGTLLHEYLKKEIGSHSRPGLSSLMIPIEKNNQKLPMEETIIDMYNYAIDYLTSCGFEHYEISNFAQPGYHSKHNLNYWNRGEYYGAGLGAHSFINGDRFHNTDDLDEYIQAISSNTTTVKSSEHISDNNALSEALFLGLRKSEGINLEYFSRRYKVNILTAYHKEIKEFQDAGLIETTTSGCSYETNLRLTRKGFLLSNEVFSKFIHNS